MREEEEVQPGERFFAWVGMLWVVATAFFLLWYVVEGNLVHGGEEGGGVYGWTN